MTTPELLKQLERKRKRKQKYARTPTGELEIVPQGIDHRELGDDQSDIPDEVFAVAKTSLQIAPLVVLLLDRQRKIVGTRMCYPKKGVKEAAIRAGIRAAVQASAKHVIIATRSALSIEQKQTAVIAGEVCLISVERCISLVDTQVSA